MVELLVVLTIEISHHALPSGIFNAKHSVLQIVTDFCDIDRGFFLKGCGVIWLTVSRQAKSELVDLRHAVINLTSAGHVNNPTSGKFLDIVGLGIPEIARNLATVILKSQ